MTQATEKQVSTELLARFLMNLTIARKVVILDFEEHYQGKRLGNPSAYDDYLSIMCLVIYPGVTL